MTPPALEISEWAQLDDGQRRRLLARPAQLDLAATRERARETIQQVRESGDRALLELTERFDRVRVESLEVGAAELESAAESVSAADRAALDIAIATVGRYHEAQRSAPLSIETAPGVVCERLELPIDSVGLYVPAGSAPLPSTAIMLAVPARTAGCRIRVLCTPPRADGRADPAVLYVARACGVQRIFKLGGAQGIAALAYGTESVPRVDKIFGPGNAWVAAAKQLVAADPEGAACDLPAGPSEVLVIADDSARPDFVAADLLAQAEHSADAQVILVATSRELFPRVNEELLRQSGQRKRSAIISGALANGRAIFVVDLGTAFEVSNRYAPEHLIIATEQPRKWLAQVTSAGSVFLGHWTPEVLGDYCSGANHVLPTYGYARSYSGLSLADFTRRITVQQATRDGLAGLGPVAQRLALLEGLDAHAHAVAVRLGAAQVAAA
ncbi:MAG: histidinol dehydrogenase [Gammaproteobacteria bacterium]|nr:histidinol dehydrogenase [Gammaproteobacteria bacterium]